MSVLVVIFGPPASGKAAVGSALTQATGLRLFHNHMTAEPVGALFGWGTDLFVEMAGTLRLQLLSRAFPQPGFPGVVLTFVWAFDLEADHRFIRDLLSVADANGVRTCFVELLASREARIAREGTPLRLELKPQKRDVERARGLHAVIDARHRMNSAGDFPYPDRHLVIDTEKHSPPEAAAAIAARFVLQEKQDNRSNPVLPPRVP